MLASLRPGYSCTPEIDNFCSDGYDSGMNRITSASELPEPVQMWRNRPSDEYAWWLARVHTIEAATSVAVDVLVSNGEHPDIEVEDNLVRVVYWIRRKDFGESLASRINTDPDWVPRMYQWCVVLDGPHQGCRGQVIEVVGAEALLRIPRGEWGTTDHRFDKSLLVGYTPEGW